MAKRSKSRKTTARAKAKPVVSKKPIGDLNADELRALMKSNEQAQKRLAAELAKRAAEVEEPVAESSRHFLAEGEALPETYRRRRTYPCPKCRRKQLPDGGQAVVATGIKNGIGSERDMAYLRCKSCGHRWSLVVE